METEESFNEDHEFEEEDPDDDDFEEDVCSYCAIFFSINQCLFLYVLVFSGECSFGWWNDN